MLIVLGGCNYRASQENEVITVTDQLGRTVTVPRHMTRISALHHFGGKIVYALGQREQAGGTESIRERSASLGGGGCGICGHAQDAGADRACDQL